jgi:phosphoglycerol transferase MdoB-like AlkP superfamily enzyme
MIMDHRMFQKQMFRFFGCFIFWMIFFWLNKAVFLLWNNDQTFRLSLGEIAGIFGYGLKMDISAACYLLIFPGLVLFFRFLVSKPSADRLVRIYTITVLVFASFLFILDLGLYPHWGTRVNITAFNYIQDAVAMKASVSFAAATGGIVSCVVLVWGFMILYKRFFPQGFAAEGRAGAVHSFLWLLLSASLIIPIRGGFDTSPMNLSSVAFSSKLYVNQAASNFVWNFGNSIDKRDKFSNPCIDMSKQESEQVLNASVRFDTITPYPRLLKNDPLVHPNVILVILEGFSNKVVAGLGGMAGIAPHLDSLCRDAVVFTRFYASGNRSDRGISALLGSYPSLLNTSVMLYPEKSRKLIVLQEYFNRQGYFTSFYYGGDINFYNLKSFVLQGNNKQVVSKADFPAETGRMTKWGVPDGYLFDKALDDLKKQKVPFFQTIYTVSSHPPYDVPYLKIRGSSVRDKYLNSVSYTDSCLGHFIRTLRQSPLWENTLLIVTSDHGHLQPGPTGISDPGTYLIPMVWSGGAVGQPQRIETIAMQSGFATTLVRQLGWTIGSHRFSGDIFRSNPFAFYMLETGWGYVTPEGSYYFDQNRKDFTPAGVKPSDQLFPKAFMQMLHEDFLSR